MTGVHFSSMAGDSFFDFTSASEFVMLIVPAMLVSYIGIIIFPLQLVCAFLLAFVVGAMAAGWPGAIFRLKKKSQWIMLGSAIGLIVGAVLILQRDDFSRNSASDNDISIIVICLITGGLCMHMWRAILEYWLQKTGHGASDEKWWISAG